MASSSSQQMQEQFRHAQQNAWQQTPPQQQPLHPMAAALPPLLPQSVSTSGAIIRIGKFSLIAASFCLMLLGAFTFLGGFLLGIWYASPLPSSATGLKEVPTLGLLPPQQPLPSYQTNPTPQGGGQQGNQRNVYTQIATEHSGTATEMAITGTQLPDVPRFLVPLVTATQTAIGKQLGHKVQQQVEQKIDSALSSSPQLPAAQPLPPTPAPLPVVIPQRIPPSSTSEGLAPPPQEEEGLYTIQLGVYAAKDNADALVNHMQALNYTSHVVEGKAADGSPLYYVHSGLYKDYTTALDAASQFASQNIPGATVVRVSKNNKSAS